MFYGGTMVLFDEKKTSERVPVLCVQPYLIRSCYRS